jgi:hypothetical protein
LSVPVAAVAGEGGEVLLGHAKRHVDRAQLVNRQERGPAVVGADDVAFVDVDVAGAPGQGGADRAVFELQAGVGEAGLAGLDLGLEGAGRVGDFLKLLL